MNNFYDQALFMVKTTTAECYNYCAFSVTALLHKIRFVWLVLFHAHSLFVSSSLPQYFYIMQLKRDEFEENYKQDRSEVPAQ